MAEKEIYRLDVNVGISGDEETKSRLSAMDKYTEKTEKRMKQLDKVESSPTVRLRDKLTPSLDKAEKRLKKFSDVTGKLGDKMTKGISVPLAGVGALATKSAIDFESAFAGARKTVDATEAEFAELETGIRGMAKEIPASASAIAEVAEAAGQLGIQTENILGFSRVMIDLGESTNMSADEAATALARFANITGMSQTEFDKLGSTIVELGNNLATTEGEIVAMGLRLAGAGSQIGLTEAQIMSFAGALSSVGIEAEAGGSAFSKLMIDMQLQTETNGKGLKDYAKVAGMTGREFKKAFQNDAAGALVSFIEGLGNAEAQGISAIKVLDDMGIKEVRLRDTLLRAAGASDVFTDSLEMGSSAWEENTALTNEANQRYETTASQLAIAKNHLVDAGITIGEIVVPHLVTLSEKVKEVANWFRDLNPEVQENAVKIAGIAIAAGPLLKIGSKISGGISGAIGLLLKFNKGADVATKTAGLLGGAKGLGSVVSGGTKAGGVLASLGSAADIGSGGIGLLMRSLGRVAPKAGPAGLAIAGVGTAAYFLYKKLNEETIPEIDLFADKTEYAAKITEDSAGGIYTTVETTTTKISEATKQAVESYMELSNQAKFIVDQMYINQTTVTQEHVDEITGIYGQMTTQVVGKVEERKNEELAILNDLFTESTTLSEIQQNEMLTYRESYYFNQQRIVEAGEKEILEIIQGAAAEERRITGDEAMRIEEIRREMREQSINILSEQEVEAGIILERMAANDERVTAEQASQHIQTLNEQRDNAIATAEQEYDERLGLATRLKNEGTKESIKMANDIIAEAVRQRDETIEAAEDTRDGAVDAIFKMNKDLIDDVDYTTGEIISDWQKLFGTWDKWEPKRKTFTVETLNRIAPAKTTSSPYPNSPLRTTADLAPEKKPFNNNVGPRRYAKGTDYHPGGLAIVGEEGPELVSLPRGSKVFTADETQAMAKNFESPTPTSFGERVSSTGGITRDVFYNNNIKEPTLDDLSVNIKYSSSVKEPRLKDISRNIEYFSQAEELELSTLKSDAIYASSVEEPNIGNTQRDVEYINQIKEPELGNIFENILYQNIISEPETSDINKTINYSDNIESPELRPLDNYISYTNSIKEPELKSISSMIEYFNKIKDPDIGSVSEDINYRNIIDEPAIKDITRSVGYNNDIEEPTLNDLSGRIKYDDIKEPQLDKTINRTIEYFNEIKKPELKPFMNDIFYRNIIEEPNYEDIAPIRKRPFVAETDEENPEINKPQVATVGTGGGNTYNIYVDDIDVNVEDSGDGSGEDVYQIVEEAQEEFGRKLLEALRDKKK